MVSASISVSTHACHKHCVYTVSVMRLKLGSTPRQRVLSSSFSMFYVGDQSLVLQIDARSYLYDGVTGQESMFYVLGTESRILS
jgi:hypothetical protein